MSAASLQNCFPPSMVETLSMWREIIVQLLHKNNAYDLSARQTAILMTVYLTPPPHTIMHISASLVISKAAVCRAVDALATAGMLKRKRDNNDKRIVNLQRTVKGSVYLSEFSDIIHSVSNPYKVAS